jgi:hypothetical protein
MQGLRVWDGLAFESALATFETVEDRRVDCAVSPHVDHGDPLRVLTVRLPGERVAKRVLPGPVVVELDQLWA